MQRVVQLVAIATFTIAGLPTSAAAQTQTINIWPGVAPGSENWKQKEVTYENTPVGTVVMNVVTPTITAYLPAKEKATGTGVIIAPGGAFVALAMSVEATDLARWLQQRGVAAFVLKYRTLYKNFEGVPQMDMDTAGRYGMADGIQAVKIVRQHAKEWNVSADRIGFIGFSAGGMVGTATLLQPDSAARPNFVALIYGAPFGVMPKIPSTLPPVFMAWAQDDNVALEPVVKFHDALIAAGIKPEAHIYNAGGHGFGMKKHGTTSDHWTDDYWNWLASLGVTHRATATAKK
jgi:acetyl esterase/lipase